MRKVLIASPVHKEHIILKEFLESLKGLNFKNVDISYCFIDDNEDLISSQMLESFKGLGSNVEVLKLDTLDKFDSNYICNENTHSWNNNLINKVTYFKNEIINRFLKTDKEYIFFLDSDLVLHPNTLQTLLEQDKDIIAEVFWTNWNIGGEQLPQVWVKDCYTLFNAHMLRKIGPKEAEEEKQQFLNTIRQPGVYEVGGLGACTLIKREPLEKGISFTEIPNLSFWGEDRHFCIRAAAFGYKLFVDTHHPALHLYRISDLSRVEDYKASCAGINIECTKDEIRKILIGENHKRNIKKCTNIIVKSEIDNYSITFDNEYINATCNFDLVEKGYFNNQSYHTKSYCVAKLKRNNLDWSLDEEVYISEKIQIEQPFIRIANPANNKLTLSMVVKNEEGRYLERVLLQHKQYIDNAIIIDDGSTDNTVEIVKSILGDKHLKLIENNNSLFSNEINLRKLQWNATLDTNPDWILNLDADEIFEDSFSAEIESMINCDLECDGYAFRLYDFWNETHYRSDKYWAAHTKYVPFLIRYQKNYKYKWHEVQLHCGRLPANIYNMGIKLSPLRLKHMGWARDMDRKIKYNRYMELDPLGTYGDLNQYKSILDKNPNLILWDENNS